MAAIQTDSKASAVLSTALDALDFYSFSLDSMEVNALDVIISSVATREEHEGGSPTKMSSRCAFCNITMRPNIEFVGGSVNNSPIERVVQTGGVNYLKSVSALWTHEISSTFPKTDGVFAHFT